MTTVQRFLPLRTPIRHCASVTSAEAAYKAAAAGADAVVLRCCGLFGSAVAREIDRCAASVDPGRLQLFVADYWWEAADAGIYGVFLEAADLDSADAVFMRKAGLRLCVGVQSVGDMQAAGKIGASCIAVTRGHADLLSAGGIEKAQPGYVVVL